MRKAEAVEQVSKRTSPGKRPRKNVPAAPIESLADAADAKHALSDEPSRSAYFAARPDFETKRLAARRIEVAASEGDKPEDKTGLNNEVSLRYHSCCFRSLATDY